MEQITTSVDSFEEMASIIRSRSACLEASEIAATGIPLPTNPSGSLVSDARGLRLWVRSSTPDSFEKLMRASAHRQTKGTIACLLDRHLEVELEGCRVEPLRWHMDSGATFCYNFNSIKYKSREIGDTGFANRPAHARIANTTLNYNTLVRTVETTCSEQGKIKTIHEPNGLSAYVGRLRFSIHQKGDDIWISAETPGKTRPTSLRDTKISLGNLLLVFNWINGGDPFPFYRSVSKKILITSTIQEIAKSIPSSPYVISSLSPNAAPGIIKLATEYFNSDSEASKDLRLFLWQYRTAAAQGPVTLSKLLHISSLLEGVVGFTLRHLGGMSEKQINKLVYDPNKRSGNAEARFHHAMKLLSFQKKSEIQQIFDIWKSVRDALAHGNLREFNDKSGTNVISPYHQMIQAFNAFILRIVGYTDPIQLGSGIYAVGHDLS